MELFKRATQGFRKLLDLGLKCYRNGIEMVFMREKEISLFGSIRSDNVELVNKT